MSKSYSEPVPVPAEAVVVDGLASFFRRDDGTVDMPLQRIVVRPIGWQRTTAAHKLVGGYLALKKLTLLLVPSPLDKKVDALITPNLLVVILDDISS